MTIWKYELSMKDVQIFEVPAPWKPLSVQMQRGVPCLWMLLECPAGVDPDAERTKAAVRIVGTGHPCDDVRGEDYVGTFQKDGWLVFHVFVSPA